MCPRKAGGSLSEDSKKLFVWISVPFTVAALEMRKKKEIENRRNQMPWPFQQGLCFGAWQISAVFTSDYLMIIFK